MMVSGENVLTAVRRAVEAAGVGVCTDDVIARRRLEARIEIEVRTLLCSCGGFDWDEDDD